MSTIDYTTLGCMTVFTVFVTNIAKKLYDMLADYIHRWRERVKITKKL
jgi:hypothetical protein